MSDTITVYLVDDEPGMLKALSRLLGSEGFNVIAYKSAADFVDNLPDVAIGCIILDVAMPGMNGMELHHHLNKSKIQLPIIFLTGHGDIPMSVRAIKSGAVDFLTKPIQANELLAAVHTAIKQAKTHHAERAADADLKARLEMLTPRELDVMRHVISGKLNKQIAAYLGTGEQNIKVHRMRMMQKMQVASVAELVRAAERLGVEMADV